MNRDSHPRSTARTRRAVAVVLAIGAVGVLFLAAGTGTARAARVATSSPRAKPAAAKPATAPAAQPIDQTGRWNLEQSPGWQPGFDPESMSVVIGRRTNAPLVTATFKGGARSLDELGRTVCRLLHRKNADSLLALCVADSEFRDVLWREFPQSRPVTGLTWEDGWTPLLQRLISGCASAVNDYGNHWYEFQRVEADSIARYKNFTLYQQVTLVARDDEGQVQRMRWLRAIAERKGRFKIYSTTD
jgi:hypothetical protein